MRKCRRKLLHEARRSITAVAELPDLYARRAPTRALSITHRGSVPSKPLPGLPDIALSPRSGTRPNRSPRSGNASARISRRRARIPFGSIELIIRHTSARRLPTATSETGSALRLLSRTYRSVHRVAHKKNSLAQKHIRQTASRTGAAGTTGPASDRNPCLLRPSFAQQSAAGSPGRTAAGVTRKSLLPAGRIDIGAMPS